LQRSDREECPQGQGKKVDGVVAADGGGLKVCRKEKSWDADQNSLEKEPNRENATPRVSQPRAGIACAGAKSVRVHPQGATKAGSGKGWAGPQAKAKGTAIASNPRNPKGGASAPSSLAPPGARGDPGPALAGFVPVPQFNL